MTLIALEHAQHKLPNNRCTASCLASLYLQLSRLCCQQVSHQAVAGASLEQSIQKALFGCPLQLKPLPLPVIVALQPVYNAIKSSQCWATSNSQNRGMGVSCQ